MSGAQPIDILRETGISRPEPDSFGVKLAIAFTEPFQQFYSALGAKEPWQRLLFGFAFGGVVMFLTEPSFAFEKGGRPRPFALQSRDPNSTYIHWSVPPIAFGLASAVFV